MTPQEFTERIWNYYLLLESDFVATLRYVDLAEDNYQTHSNEYVKLMLSICSEVDVVCKEMCASIDCDAERKNIDHYRATIHPNTDIANAKAINLQSQAYCLPWEMWNHDKNPDWWRAYNDLKHNRLTEDNYKIGNLKNVYGSLSGLYILCRYLYKRIGSRDPQPASQLFKVDGWSIYHQIGDGITMRVDPNKGISIL